MYLQLNGSIHGSSVSIKHKMNGAINFGTCTNIENDGVQELVAFMVAFIA